MMTEYVIFIHQTNLGYARKWIENTSLIVHIFTNLLTSKILANTSMRLSETRIMSARTVQSDFLTIPSRKWLEIVPVNNTRRQTLTRYRSSLTQLKLCEL